MLVCLGLSLYNLGIWHLTTHAFFKSLLFLTSGALIHGLFIGTQDVRKYGYFNILLPFSYTAFLIGSLALMAAPFLSGMYSKDFLLEILCIPSSFTHTLTYLLTLFGALLTSLYTLKTFINVFFITPQFEAHIRHYQHTIVDSLTNMTLPLFILSFLAIIIGYLLNDLYIGAGLEIWNSSLFTHPLNNRYLDILGISSYLPLIPFLFFIPLFFLNLPFFSTRSNTTPLQGSALSSQNPLVNHVSPGPGLRSNQIEIMRV